ncbi:TATA box-binding protein-associated factor RNA polymerase I subunit A isoform X1 [Salmo salar]|uniref:TATA box-binding protein-associated factor RNA polymerase I subunit A isoform X1 n=1 Tax=Salmo salar TaxID=8030 RepID=A0A1S3S733_SALSA|nr:TATA box-binding protein-associated factor RNA polymerase I subunit A isoform X1 [Salmo salar]
MDDLESEPRVPGEEQGENESSDDDESINRKRIKKQNLPLAPPLFKETTCETGFHKTTRNCLQHIREDLLHHRWQDAADYMASYSQTLEDTTANMPQLYAEIIWRIGTEILHHHPDSKLEDYNSFYERVKHSGVKNYLKVCLEHSFHLLVNGQFEDAKRQLSIAESWRYGKLSAGQSQRIRLIQAYSGFLDYFIWCDKKATASSTDEYDAAVNQEMHSYFRQSSVNLKEIMKLPGVWDPFVLSYIDMLEFYNDHEGAVKVLNDYAYDKSFPPNPNAHVYLYRYMKKQNHPLKKLLKVLKILHTLVPSHELMPEYCSLLVQSVKDEFFPEKEGDLQKALGVVLDLLDYSSWRSNLAVWNHLMNIIKRLRMKKQWLKIFAEEMGYRKDWWLAIHFSTFQARKDSAENRELLEVKSFVVGAFCPRYTSMYCGVGKAARKGVTSEVQKAKRNPKQLRNIRRLRRESGQQSQD